MWTCGNCGTPLTWGADFDADAQIAGRMLRYICSKKKKRQGNNPCLAFNTRLSRKSPLRLFVHALSGDRPKPFRPYTIRLVVYHW